MKILHYVSAVASVAMVVLCFSQNGYADLVTLHFLGEVTVIKPTSNKYSWGTEGYFRVGDQLDGSFSYQSGQLPFGQGDPTKSGSYSKYKTEAISFSVGNISGAAAGGELFVYDGYSNSHKDQYGFWADIRDDHLTANGYPHPLFSFSLALEDSTGTVFETSALPLTAPDLADFTSTRITLYFGQGLRADGVNYDEYLLVSGKVTSLKQTTPIATPVPASMLLLGSGLIGIACRGLKKRTRQSVQVQLKNFLSR
ncbi:MAG: PEP-CTERM sorting domain-containing protein [Chlorobium sp.]|nr:PEP-CTERM sorting domain-containing protein [Chlorobium sp.]